jgi:hypothetical protein
MRDLRVLMRKNAKIRETFGSFRGQKFYQGSVKNGMHRASIFAVSQFLSKLAGKYQIWVDGTFNIVPRFAAQVLVIMGTVSQKVKSIR